MNKISTNVLRLAVVLLLVFTLSGCDRGARRLNSGAAPGTFQPGQSQLTSPSPAFSGTPDAVSPEAGGSGKAEGTPPVSSGSQAEDLLDAINTLDAANQAGDPLDDLP